MDLLIFSVLCTRSIAFTAVSWGRDLREGVGVCGGGDAAVAIRDNGEAFMLGVTFVCLQGAFRNPTTTAVPSVAARIRAWNPQIWEEKRRRKKIKCHHRK
ncbi:hypothetical protein E2542_SST01433 [Spatholobus suberectus]|nr:hypothetical protein E2542_SST01433 [Spatholobus suberectus]